MKKSFLIFIFLFLVAGQSFAADVTLSWTQPDDNRVAGYAVYYWPYDVDRAEATEISIAGATTTSTPITGLSEGQTYNFAARSVADNGMMSDWSETVDYAVPVYIPKRPETLVIQFGE